MKKLFKILIIVVLFNLILSFGLAFAQDSTLEGGDYPDFGDEAPNPPSSVNTYLPRYIRYIYYTAIICGGLITLITIIYGGFRFLTSAGNPAATTDARNQIASGFLGLILILGSYILLNEINPDLITLQLPDINVAREGIILYNKQCGELGNIADLDIPELAELDEDIRWKAMNSSGSTDLDEDSSNQVGIYPKSFYSFSDANNLKLELFNNEDCTGDSTSLTDLTKDVCIDFPVETKCIKFVWTIPGVWIFNQLNNGNAPDPLNLPLGWVEGRQYKIIQQNYDSLPGNFHDDVEALALVPKKPDGASEGLVINYGAILHNIPGGLNKEKGWANLYFNGMEECNPGQEGMTLCKIGSSGKAKDASSITVFALPEVNDVSFGSVEICRNDRCEFHRVGDKYYDATLSFTPTSSGYDATTAFYIKDLSNETWGDYNKSIIMQKNHPDGVSSIELHGTSPYLVLLYEKHYTGSISQINDNSTDVAIINQTIPSLKTIRMNGRVGTIVVISTVPEY